MGDLGTEFSRIQRQQASERNSDPANGLTHERLVRNIERVFAQTDLDGDFPARCRADELDVRRIENVIPCADAQTGISKYEP